MTKNIWIALSVGLIACGMSACTQRTVLHGMNEVKPSFDKGQKINVWFVKSENEKLILVPVPRTVSGEDKIAAATAELLKGPNEAELANDLGTEIPKGAILLGVTKNGNDVELNLSKRFALGGGVSSFETRLGQLSKTMKEVAGNSRVYLDIEGKRLNVSEGEGIEIPQPINR